MKKYLFLLSVLAIIHGGCGSESKKVSSQPEHVITATKYTNPVFEPILADPTVVKADDGYFYAFGTEDNWGDGKPGHLVAVVRSKNLINWNYLRDAFVSKPRWKTTGGLWAPDVVKVNGNYHLYYSYSTWDDPDPGIGVASSSTPAGPYMDEGKIFFSSEVEVPNSIDPFYYEEDGKKYLFWGSFSSTSTQGTYGIELKADGLRVADITKKFKIAAGDFEGVVIHKRGRYYYFFGSKGGCCAGAASTYNIRVGRSERLQGPYVDKAGKDIANRGYGTLILQGNSQVAGPGHNARIFTDDNGVDWLIYHGILKSNPTVSSGASRRTLMIDKLTWVNDWPEIEGNTPSFSEKEGPSFK